MNWETIKSKIYLYEGQLKEIVVYNTSEEYWKKWIEYVNDNYKLEWNYYDEMKFNKIDFNRIKYFWDHPEKCYQTSCIFYIDNIQIGECFWEPNTLVNFFWPYDIITENNHNKIIEYMKNVSKIMENDIFLNDENQSRNQLFCYQMKINNNIIEYNI